MKSTSQGDALGNVEFILYSIIHVLFCVLQNKDPILERSQS